MSSSSPRRPTGARLIALALLCIPAGCGPGEALVVRVPATPTVTPAPALTPSPSLPLSGKRDADAEVWAIRDDGTQVRLAAADGSTDWSGSLPLGEGSNGFKLVAVRGHGYSRPSDRVEVVLDTLPPRQPTVLAPDGVALHGAASVTLTLTGTKGADGDLAIDGVVRVPVDGATTWTAEIIVQPGDNAMALTSRDKVGNVGAPVPLTLFATALDGPTFDILRGPPGVNYTNLTTIPVSGTKPVAAALTFVQGGVAQALGFVGQAHWNTQLTLTTDGTVDLGAYVTDASVDPVHHSPTATARLIRKTTVPVAPSVDAPASWPNLGVTASSSATLTGKLGPDSYVCLSALQNGPCLARSAGSNGRYTITVPLNGGACDVPGAPCTSSGAIDLWVSARDQAGNVSLIAGNSHGTVYRISPPQVSQVSPAAGAVVTATPLTVSFSAAPWTGDVGRPEAAVASVKICLDGACTDVPPQAGGTYSQPMDLSQAAPGSSHTVTVTVVSSGGGRTVLTLPVVYSPGNAPIYLSHDGSAKVATLPKVARDSAGNLHVVWQSECAQVGAPQCTAPISAQQMPPDIFYVRRDANGGWGSLINLSASDATDGHSQSPDIVVDAADTVHVVWSDDGQIGGKPARYGIVHRTLTAAGVPAGTIDVVGSPDPAIDDAEPALAADLATGAVHLAYTHRRNTASAYDIRYAKLTGGAWSAPLTVSFEAGFNGSPAIAAAAAGRAQVAWQNCSTDTSLSPARNYCAPSSDPSLSGDARAAINYDIWLGEVVSPTTLGWRQLISGASKQTGQDGDSRQPALVVDAQNTAWTFYTDTGTLQGATRRNVWQRRNLDGGAPDGNGYTLVSTDTTSLGAEAPAAALDAAGDLTVTWTARIDAGNSDIWSRSGTVALGLGAQVLPIYASPQPSNFSAVVLDPGGNLQVVWDDQSAFAGGVNAAQAEQIFTLYLPRPPT